MKYWCFARNTLSETKIQKFTPLSETPPTPASGVNIC